MNDPGPLSNSPGWQARKLALLLIVVFHAVALLEALHGYQAERRSSELLLSALSSSTAYQVGAALRNIDALVLDAKERLESKGTLSPSDAEHLAGRVKATPEVVDMLISNAKGEAVSLLNLGQTNAAFSVSDREYFTFWNEHPDRSGLHISVPITSRSTGRTVVPVSHVLKAPDGSFNGVVASAVTVKFLLDVLAAANNRDTASGVIFMADGTVLARVPRIGEGVEQRVPNVSWTDSFLFKQEEKTFDGRPRFVGLRPVGNFPILASSTLTVSEAMASWYRQMALIFSASALLSVSIFVLALLADRREHARQIMAETVKIQRDNLEIIVAERTKELADLAGRMKASNAELEQFAYVTSHDLQEPLRMISSYAQLLQKRYGGQLDANADDFIGFMVEGVKRMRRLIFDLLEYSRVTNKNHPFEEFDAAEAVEAALANLAAAIKESKARISLGGLPVIWGDRTQFIQLIQNLVGNALKYHHPNRAPHITITSEEEETGWCFTVSDNGIGIESQYFERVFKMFQRLHTRDQYDGTGIGLAICKKIVDRHEGHIWVDSVAGEGASFVITLPKLPPDAALNRFAEESPPAPAPTSPRRAGSDRTAPLA